MKMTYNGFVKPFELIIIMVIVFFWIALVSAQEKKPPAPEEPASNLRMPKAVKFQEMKGRAILPNELKLGFALDLSERVLLGNWDIKGKVTAVDNKKVTFVTEKDETGNLVLRMPEGFKLSLVTSEPVSIKRKMIGYQASMGYDLVMVSTERLVIASGRLLGDMSQEVKILDGLALKQGRDLGQVLTESKYETVYQVPVTLSTDSQNIQIVPGESREVTVHGKVYQVFINQSSKVVASKEYEGVAEGSGYVLEYIAVSR